MPDIVYLLYDNNILVYQVISLLWTAGFFLDPVIYISVNAELRSTACGLLRRWCFCRDKCGQSDVMGSTEVLQSRVTKDCVG